MKISNSAALFLASSAAFVSQSHAFTTAPASLSMSTTKVQTLSSSFSSSSSSSRRRMAAEDDAGGKSKVTEVDEMQLKRMNYEFNRGAGSGSGVDDTPRMHPLMDIQSYVPVAEPALTRKNIQDSTCIVSGSPSRATPELFYLLNSEDSNFGFNKIVAVSTDVKQTKKTLLTRTARYTGLLSKLAYEEGSVVPPASVLEEASSWIALVDTPEDLKTLIPSAASVENLSILFFYGADVAQSQLESLSSELMAANPDASLVLVSQADVMEDPNEDPLDAESKPTPIMYYYEQGKGEPLVISEEASTSTSTSTSTVEAKDGEEEEAPVSIEPTLVHDEEFTFEEARRLAIECLQLQAGAGKTLMVQCIEKKGMLEMNQLIKQKSPSTQNMFTKLILGLREAGYERPQEISYMLDKGVGHMQEAIEKFGQANPGAVKSMQSGAGSSEATRADGEPITTTTNAWWEDPEFQKLVKESSLRKEQVEDLKKKIESGEEETEEATSSVQ